MVAMTMCITLFLGLLGGGGVGFFDAPQVRRYITRVGMVGNM